MTSAESAPSARHLLWECGCLRDTNEVWLWCDEKGEGRVGRIHLNERGVPQLELTSCKVLPYSICSTLVCECIHPAKQVHSRVITLYHEPASDLMLLGTLDFVLQAIDCKLK